MRLLPNRAGLRLLHSVSPRLQQIAVGHQNKLANSQDVPSPISELVDIVDGTTSTNNGDAVSRADAIAPHEIFASWRANSFYAPLAFLRSRRMRPDRKRKAPPLVGPGAAEAAQEDVFLQLDIDPIYESNNDALLSTFVTTMGRIRPRSQTRLSWRSQRKVTQAIKSSKQKGILPITYKPRFNIPNTYK